MEIALHECMEYSGVELLSDELVGLFENNVSLVVFAFGGAHEAGKSSAIKALTSLFRTYLDGCHILSGCPFTATAECSQLLHFAELLREKINRGVILSRDSLSNIEGYEGVWASFREYGIPIRLNGGPVGLEMQCLALAGYIGIRYLINKATSSTSSVMLWDRSSKDNAFLNLVTRGILPDEQPFIAFTSLARIATQLGLTMYTLPDGTQILRGEKAFIVFVNMALTVSPEEAQRRFTTKPRSAFDPDPIQRLHMHRLLTQGKDRCVIDTTDMSPKMVVEEALARMTMRLENVSAYFESQKCQR